MNKNTHNFSKKLISLSKKKKITVGIGLFNPDKEAIKYLRLAKEIVDVVLVGSKIKGFESYVASNEEEAANKLIELLDSKKIGAIVRGQIHPRYLCFPLLGRIGKERSCLDGSGKIMPVIFENKKTGRFFILASADLTQGFDIRQRKMEIIGMVNYLVKNGVTPYVGIMTMRRPKPKNAKKINGFNPFPIVEQTFKYAEITSKFLVGRGVRSDLFYIEYETAIKAGVNIIIPPIGPIGNAIARTLVFLSDEWEMIGAPALHYKPYTIEEVFKTASAKIFYNNIISAAASANSEM